MIEPVFEIFAQEFRVDDIAVVRQGEIARIVTEQERLDVLHPAASGRRVADVADGHRALQRGEFLLVEDLGHQASALDAAERTLFIHRDNPGTLLPAVLQRMESVIGQRSSIRHPVDTEDPALLVQFAVADHFFPHVIR